MKMKTADPAKIGHQLELFEVVEQCTSPESFFQPTRSCDFCGRRFRLDELPDGSLIFAGRCACASCFVRPVAADFRRLVDAA